MSDYQLGPPLKKNLYIYAVSLSAESCDIVVAFCDTLYQWIVCFVTDLFIVTAVCVCTLTGWFKAVQALQSLGLIGLGIACLFCFVVNCCQTSGSFTRFLELMAGTGGMY